MYFPVAFQGEASKLLPIELGQTVTQATLLQQLFTLKGIIAQRRVGHF